MSQTQALIIPSLLVPQTKFTTMLLPVGYVLEHSKELIITGVGFNAPALKAPFLLAKNARIELRFTKGALSVAQALSSKGSIIEPDKAVLNLDSAIVFKIPSFKTLLAQLNPVEVGEITIRDPVAQSAELLEQLASRIDILAKPYVDTYLVYSAKQDLLTRVVYINEFSGAVKVMLLGSTPLLYADSVNIDEESIVQLEYRLNRIYALNSHNISGALIGKYAKNMSELRLAYNDFIAKRQDMFIARFMEQVSKIKQEMEETQTKQESSEDQI